MGNSVGASLDAISLRHPPRCWIPQKPGAGFNPRWPSSGAATLPVGIAASDIGGQGDDHGARLGWEPSEKARDPAQRRSRRDPKRPRPQTSSPGARSRAAQIAPRPNAPPPSNFSPRRAIQRSADRAATQRAPALKLLPQARDPAKRRSLGSRPGDSPYAKPPRSPPLPTHPPSDRRRAQGRPPMVERASAFEEIRSAAGGRGKDPG